MNTEAQREMLGLKVGASEAEPFWTEFRRSLNRRGLRGVKPVAKVMEDEDPEKAPSHNDSPAL